MDSKVAAITSSPLLGEAFQKITTAVNKAVDEGEIKPITDADTNVEQKINDGVLAVKYADPTKIDPELPKSILFHATKNNIALPESSVNALKAIDALIQAKENYYANALTSNTATAADVVAHEIETAGPGSGTKGDSFLTYFDRVKDAMNRGQPLEAQGIMDDFAMFLQHMSNKVRALNEHYEAGNSKAAPRTYQSLNSDTREWFNSNASTGDTKGMSITPHNWDSVKMAQRVDREAKFGADLYNALSQAFPDLAAGTAAVTPLAQGLQGDFKKVAAAHKNVSDIGRQPTNEYARSADAVTGSPRVSTMLGQDAINKNPIPDSAKKVKVENHSLYVSEDGNTVWDVKGKELTSANWINAAKTAAGFSNQQAETLPTKTEQEPSQNKQQVSEVPAKDTAVDNILSPEQSPKEEKQPVQNKSETSKSKQQEDTPKSPVDDKQPMQAEMDDLREKLKEAQDDNEKLRDAQEELEKLSTKPETPKKAVFVARKAPQRKITDTDRAKEKARLEAERDAELAADIDAPNPLGADEKIQQTYDLIGEQYGDIEPWFAKAYRAPKRVISYLFGNAKGAFKAVTGALDNAGAMIALRNDNPLKKNFSTDQKIAVANFIAVYGRAIVNNINEMKDAFLDKKIGATIRIDGKSVPNPSPDVGKTYRQMLAEGNDLIQNYAAGRALAIVDSDLNFNQNLLESAVLAGLNYVIGGNKQTPNIDDETVKAVFGIPSDTEIMFTPDITNKLMNSVDEDAVIRDIANEIIRFWGVQENKDAPINFSRGIAEALAANIMASLTEKTQLVDRVTLTLPDLPNKAVRYEFKQANIDNELSQQKGISDLLNHVIESDPVDTYYFHPNRVPSRDTQVHSNTPITAEQKQVQDMEKRNPFKFNIPMLGLYRMLGTDSLVRILGGGEMVGDRVLNKNHEQSLQGQNTAVYSALSQLEDMIAAALQYAEETGQDFDTVELFFEYVFTSVNRMHMQGRYNAQSNKVIREIVMPNESVVDLTDDKTRYNWTKALAQALGVKVHNNLNAANEADFTKLIEGKFKPVIDLLTEQFITSNDYNSESISLEKVDDEFARELAAAIDDSFGSGKATAAGIHALVDYARYLRSEDRTKFRTMAYLEADGVTNGAANSMAMFISGMFSDTWLKNMRKVGLFFKPTTMNEHRSNDDRVDLYETSAKNTSASMGKEYDSVTNMHVKRAFEQAFNVLTALSKDFTFTPVKGSDGFTIQMERGFMKNPLTVTLYGSGVDGISSKIVREMISDVIYSRASNIAAVDAKMTMNHPQAGVHFFSDLKISDADKVAKFNKLKQDLSRLAETEVARNKSQVLFTQPSTQHINWNQTAADFTIPGTVHTQLMKNVSELIGVHINQGIKDTVGNDLMRSLEQVKVAINAQSIMMERMYKAEVAKALAEKRKNPLWGNGDFLSQNELDAINEKLAQFSPLVQTGRQNFNISGGEKAPIRGLSFSRALNDKIRTAALFDSPSAAGVKAIPYLNIGMGDGLMMQVLSLMPELKGTLKIFDGMHMPVDKIDQYGEAANKAVIETWINNNPVKAVAETYKKFTDAITGDMGLSRDDWADIYKASLTKEEAFFRAEFIKNMDTEEFIQGLKGKNFDLNMISIGIVARQKVLANTNFFVDQMAASQAPANNKGKLDLSNRTDEQIVEALNIAYNNEMARSVRTETNAVQGDAILARTRNQSTVALPDGSTGRVGTLNPAALKRFLGKLRGSVDQKVMLREVARLVEAAGITAVFGTKESIAAMLGDAAPARLTEAGTEVSAWYDAGTKTIYTLNGSMETMLHELIHATTYAKVYQHYTQGNVDATTAESINEIEKLMTEYLASENPDRAIVDEIQNVMGRDDLSDTAKQAAVLNEFMAWSLANRSIAANLADTPVPTGVKAIAQKVFQAIRKMLWPRISDKNVPQPMNNFLATLQFHTGVVMRSQANFATDVQDVNLFMARKFGGSELAERTAQAMLNKLTAHLKPEAIKEAMRVDPTAAPRQAALTRATSNAVTLTNTAVTSGFQLNPLEAKVFRDASTVLATGAEIDPIFLAQAQTLYTHALKTLTREDFMVDPMSTDPNDIAQAQTKYDLVSGKAGVLTDIYGRSSILPTFIALSMSSPEFNKVLSKIPTPKTVKNMAGTLDAALENIGNAGMEKLGEWASGQGMNQKNIAGAMNAMANDLVRNHQDAGNLLTRAGDLFGERVDTANAFLVKNMRKGADGLVKAADRTKSTLMKSAARVVASVISDTHASNTAEALNEAMSGVNGFQAVRDFLGDLLGRLDSNASVYDMVKTVRAMVQQTRQQYKEELPKTLRSKFTKELSKEQWNSLHAGLGKTDISSLFGSLGNAGIQDILTNQQKLVNEITNAEKAIQSTFPSNWLVLQAKSKQLAEFMNTGKTGNNLLRNAYAVASMLGENGYKNAAPNPDLVNAIDRLVSLYAVRDMAPAHKQHIRDLYNTEANGINYVIGSLKAQRQFELDKATNNENIRMNAYKGYIPLTQAENTSVIVASSAQHAELLQRGYKRIAPYSGSNLDADSYGMSYYMAEHPTNSSFNQGIAQNVRLTSNGVDIASGRTVNLYGAGRITNRALVDRIVNASKKAAGDYQLMPVYNKDGKVVALERSIDPSIVTQSKPFQDVASSIGIWRGRQMEESMATEINRKLVDNLHEMFRTDRAAGTHTDSYVNILDPKVQKADPVLADAVKLLSNDIVSYAQGKFGNGQFLVRKDTIKETLGYREASLGDAFTGNTRWSKTTIDQVRNISQAIWGNDAYNKLTKFERNWQGLMHDARILIVVKSMIVPVANMVSNVMQLKGRGVPWTSIANGIPRKLKETEFYVQSQIEKIRLEADLAAETAPNELTKIRTRLKAIEDSHKRMSIWPLIQAGEFSAVTDVGVVSEEDVDLVGGKLHQYVDKMVNKLPDGLRTVGRYAVISEDTALFRGLQKSVQYGDFLAKAILFEDMMTRQKLTKEQALAKITEEFVNYDILPGRDRGYLEKMGLVWFYNFKLRAAKIGLNMLRNNPLHSLIASHIPAPDGLGAGMPITDSITGKLMNGSFTYSLGPGMALRSPTLLPWINLVD